MGAPGSAVRLSDLGLPLRTSTVLWKKDHALTVDGIVSAVAGELRRSGAKLVRIEDGIEATLNPDMKVRPLSQWLRSVPYQNLRHVAMQVRQTDRAFHLVFTGHTTVLFPVSLLIYGYVLTSALPSGLAFLAPFVGLAVALAYWGIAWATFGADARTLTRKSAAGVHVGAA